MERVQRLRLEDRPTDLRPQLYTHLPLHLARGSCFLPMKRPRSQNVAQPNGKRGRALHDLENDHRPPCSGCTNRVHVRGGFNPRRERHLPFFRPQTYITAFCQLDIPGWMLRRQMHTFILGRPVCSTLAQQGVSHLQ